MNCPFCNKPSDQCDDAGTFKIYLCDNHNEWIVEYPETNPIWNWVSMFNDDYLIEINIKDNKTTLFDLKNPGRNPDDHSCLRLNYLIDLSPENASQWTEKLIKLKSFY